MAFPYSALGFTRDLTSTPNVDESDVGFVSNTFFRVLRSEL